MQLSLLFLAKGGTSSVWGTILVLAVLAVIVGLVIRSIVKKLRAGQPTCGCGCSSCSHCCPSANHTSTTAKH